MGWAKDIFRFDGIQNDEISSDSDWQWLTPMERIGVQTQFDAECAKRIIDERKDTFSTVEEWRIYLIQH